MNVKLKVKLVLLEMLSLLAMSIILIFFSLWIATGEVNIRIEETLQAAVHGYSGDTSYLRNKGQEIDITLFEGDTRIDSSIKSAIGTKASEQVIETVLNKQQTYFDTNVTVNGIPYYGYYEPTETGMIFAGKPRADVQHFLLAIFLILLGLGAAAYVICSLISAMIASSITKRIQTVADQVVVLASGDLSGEIPATKPDSRDEVDIIAHSVAVLHKALKEIVTDISNQTEQLNLSNNEFSNRFTNIAASVGNINQSIEDIAAGSSSQAHETNSASSQVSDMADVIDNNSDNIANLETAASRMIELSKQAESTLSHLIQINQRTSENIITVSEQTNATNDSAEKIKNAVQMIQNIAEQTNLLSLNASIEAARAGEAGRGFAVVAEEIRKLSEDSASSANEIELIVKELLENSNISVQTMEEVSDASSTQQEKLSHTQNAFQELKSEVDTVYDVSKNIYEQTKRLEEQKNTIHGFVRQLAAISQENASSTEETSTSIQTLSDTIEDCRQETVVLADLSNNLQRQTSRFKL